MLDKQMGVSLGIGVIALLLLSGTFLPTDMSETDASAIAGGKCRYCLAYTNVCSDLCDSRNYGDCAFVNNESLCCTSKTGQSCGCGQPEEGSGATCVNKDCCDCDCSTTCTVGC